MTRFLNNAILAFLLVLTFINPSFAIWGSPRAGAVLKNLSVSVNAKTMKATWDGPQELLGEAPSSYRFTIKNILTGDVIVDKANSDYGNTYNYSFKEDGSYSFTVKYFNKRSGDLIDLETAEFVVNSEDKLPSKTNKILPNGLITDVEPLIEWDHAVGAQSYKLILYKFDEIKKHWNRVTQAITSDNYYKIEDRLDPGNYKVRVISINSVGHSKYAQGIFVLTPEPETVPSMVTAMKLEDLDDGLFIISWDAQEAAHFYNLTIDVQGAPGIENYPRIYNDSYITLSSIDGRIIYKLNKDLIINDYKDQGLTSLEPLPEAGTYRIRVYANNSLGRGPAQKGSKRLYIGCQNNNHVDNYCL